MWRTNERGRYAVVSLPVLVPILPVSSPAPWLVSPLALSHLGLRWVVMWRRGGRRRLVDVAWSLTWGGRGRGHGLFINVRWLWCGGRRRGVVVVVACSSMWRGGCGVAIDVAVVNVEWSWLWHAGCGMLVVAWWLTLRWSR